MRIEALTRASEDLAAQLEKAAEGGDAQSSFNLSSTLNNVEQERRQLLAEKARLENKPKEEDDSRPQRELNRPFFNGGYAQNNARAAALIGTGRDMAAGTGLDLYGFLRLATNYASHGAKTQNEAIADTRQAALFANRTGADANGALSFLGTMRRFGESEDALGIANYAREQTGMRDAQSDEFLSSMSALSRRA